MNYSQAEINQVDSLIFNSQKTKIVKISISEIFSKANLIDLLKKFLVAFTLVTFYNSGAPTSFTKYTYQVNFKTLRLVASHDRYSAVSILNTLLGTAVSSLSIFCTKFLMTLISMILYYKTTESKIKVKKLNIAWYFSLILAINGFFYSSYHALSLTETGNLFETIFRSLNKFLVFSYCFYSINLIDSTDFKEDEGNFDGLIASELKRKISVAGERILKLVYLISAIQLSLFVLLNLNKIIDSAKLSSAVSGAKQLGEMTRDTPQTQKILKASFMGLHKTAPKAKNQYDWEDGFHELVSDLVNLKAGLSLSLIIWFFIEQLIVHLVFLVNTKYLIKLINQKLVYLVNTEKSDCVNEETELVQYVVKLIGKACLTCFIVLFLLAILINRLFGGSLISVLEFLGPVLGSAIATIATIWTFVLMICLVQISYWLTAFFVKNIIGYSRTNKIGMTIFGCPYDVLGNINEFDNTQVSQNYMSTFNAQHYILSRLICYTLKLLIIDMGSVSNAFLSGDSITLVFNNDEEPTKLDQTTEGLIDFNQEGFESEMKNNISSIE